MCTGYIPIDFRWNPRQASSVGREMLDKWKRLLPW